jgi:hypothetical protein
MSPSYTILRGPDVLAKFSDNLKISISPYTAIANYMGHCPSLANSHSKSLEISRLVWNSNVNFVWKETRLRQCKTVYTEVIDYSENVTCVLYCCQAQESREGVPFGAEFCSRVSKEKWMECFPDSSALNQHPKSHPSGWVVYLH